MVALRAERGLSPAPAGKGPSAARSVPLELSALISPHRNRGKLTFRIERLPQLARLSAGQNNGDNSWSLGVDDLDGLLYFPPTGIAEEHALTLRIIAKNEGEASTLALLEIPVPAEGQKEASRAPTVLANFSGAEIERKKPAEKDAKPLRVVEGANDIDAPPVIDIEAIVTREVSAARAIWKGEFERQLAEVAAKASADLETSRLTAQVEREAALAVREREFTDRLVKALDDVRRDAQISLSESEKQWRRDEAARLSAVETQWQADVQKARTEAEDTLAQVRNQGDAIAAQLRDELATLQAAFAEREAAAGQATLQQADQQWREKLAAVQSQAEVRFQQAAAEARSQLDTARQQGEMLASELREEIARLGASLAEREQMLALLQTSSDRIGAENRQAFDMALASAEQSWKAGESARIAAMETQAQAAAQQAENLTSQLRDEISRLTASLAERDLLIGRLQSSSDRQGEESRQAFDTALSSAQQAWQADEKARLAALEADWHAKLQSAAVDAREQIEAARQQADQASSRMRDELAKIQSALVEREAALSRAQATQIPADARQLVDAELAAARALWQAEETSRLKAAEAQWQHSADETSAALAARCEAAEAELVTARAAAARSGHQEDGYIRNLNHELKTLQASLVDREAALARAHAHIDELRQSVLPDLPPTRSLSSFRAAPDERGEKKKDTLVRDVVLIVAAVVVGILFLPGIDSYLPWSSQPQAPQAAAPVEAPAAAPVLPVAAVTRSVNLRAEPSTTAAIVTNLRAGSTVSVAEKQGNWARVETEKDGRTLQGWVFGAYLGSADAAQAQPAAAPATVNPAPGIPRESAPSHSPAQENAVSPAQSAEAPAAEPAATAPVPENAGEAPPAP